MKIPFAMSKDQNQICLNNYCLYHKQQVAHGELEARFLQGAATLL